MNYKALEVEVLRGNQVESTHQVMAVIYSHQQIETFGNGDFPTFPRSSLKPIQALPLILSGTADHFKVTDQELAIACASHRGEEIHVSVVQNWLNRIGCTISDLECGTHAPANIDSLYRLVRSQSEPSAIHNNCSGKHTGMLATAKYLNEPTKNYVSLQHPVQQRIQNLIEKFCRVNLTPANFGIDGCSIPVPCIALSDLAEGICEFASPSHLSDLEAEACRRIFKAFVSNPVLTSGTGHYCTEVMKELNEKVLLKVGAEGVMIVAIPELKLGMALKAVDGNSRAAEICTSFLLHKYGLMNSTTPYLRPKIYNWSGIETGEIKIKG